MSSVTIADLENAKRDTDFIAEIAVSSSPTATDRLGGTRKTIAGVMDFLTIATDSVLSSVGYLVPVPYIGGLSLTLNSETVEYLGIVYAPVFSALPFVTSGVFETAKFRVIQGVVGVDLASDAGAALIGTATGVTLAALLSPLVLLGAGSASHSDGTNTLTGSARWFLGNATPSTQDAALLIGRSLTGSYIYGAHAIQDETTYNASGTGLLAYASFDSLVTLTGAATYDHLRGFQARPQYAGSATLNELAGVHSQVGATGVGVVTNAFGLKIDNPTGSGSILNMYGIWIDPLTRGSNGNFAIFSGSTTLRSYHGGRWQLGGNMDAAGNGTFGDAVYAKAFDARGAPSTFNADGGLGLYGYDTDAYARIQAYSDGAGTGKNLSINSNGGKILVGTTIENGTPLVQIEGAFRFIPEALANPNSNGYCVFEATSNVSFTVKLKGSDGVVRSASLVLT